MSGDLRERTEKQQWHTYVWLDRSGEPRSIQTTGPTHDSWDVLDQYPSLTVACDISGHPPKGDGLFFAIPFAVHKSPIASLPGVILLCQIHSADGKAQNELEDAALKTKDSSVLDIAGGQGPLEELEAIEIEQQFYLTTKFLPVSFASNAPAKPGPFGSGVGADLAVARRTVVCAANWLVSAGFGVGSVTPQATPSHWGVGIRLAEGSMVRSLADGLMLFRFFIGRACEDSNLTPAFISQVLKPPWPPSVLKVTAKVRTPPSSTVTSCEITTARRLQSGHVDLMRNTAPTKAAREQEVEEYVWVSNGKGPVTVVGVVPNHVWLVDNRIPSSANPYVALDSWMRSWV